MSLPEGFPCSIPSGQNTQEQNTEFLGNMSVSVDSSRLIDSYLCSFVLKNLIYSLRFNLCAPEVTSTEFGAG